MSGTNFLAGISLGTFNPPLREEPGEMFLSGFEDPYWQVMCGRKQTTQLALRDVYDTNVANVANITNA